MAKNKDYVNQHVDSVLYSYGTDLVGVELEFSSTVGRESIDLSMFTDFFHSYENELRESRPNHSSFNPGRPQCSASPQIILATDEDSDRFGHLSGIEFHTDSSIKPSRNGYPGTVEICSQPTLISNVVQYLILLNERMKNIGSTNNSCGTHFHFSSSRLSFNDIIKLQLGISIFEPLFYGLSKNNRIAPKYCKPIGHLFSRDDILAIQDEDDLERKILGTALKGRKTSQIFNKYGPDLTAFKEKLNARYLGFNIFSHFYRGSIEFRYFENKSLESNIIYFLLTKSVLSFLLNSKLSTIKNLVNTLHSHYLKGNSYIDFFKSIEDFYIDDDVMEACIEEYNKFSVEKDPIYKSAKEYFIRFIEMNKFRRNNLENLAKMSKVHDKTCFTANIIGMILSGKIDERIWCKWITDSYISLYGNSNLNFTDMNFYTTDLDSGHSESISETWSNYISRYLDASASVGNSNTFLSSKKLPNVQFKIDGNYVYNLLNREDYEQYMSERDRNELITLFGKTKKDLVKVRKSHNNYVNYY